MHHCPLWDGILIDPACIHLCSKLQMLKAYECSTSVVSEKVFHSPPPTLGSYVFPAHFHAALWTLKWGRQTHCLGRHTQTSLFLKALTRCASLRSLTVIHCKRKLFWPRLRAPLIYEYEHKCLTICFFSKISVVALWTGLEFLVWTHGVGHKSRKIAKCCLQSHCATAAASGLAGWYNIWYCFNGMQGPLLVETVDNFAFSAAFIIPSTPRKDIQKRENFWLNLSLIFFSMFYNQSTWCLQ